MRAVVVLSLLTLCSGQGVTKASDLNFAKVIADKTAFVKFFAPWCGHCKTMAPEWEKLAKHFAGVDGLVIAEVDCTADGQNTCQSQGLQGYPTVKLFKPNGKKTGEDYGGPREFAELKSFVEKNLQQCNVVTGQHCAPNAKEYIAKQKGKSVEEISADLENKLSELKTIVAEREAAEIEFRVKQAEWKKKEKNLGKAVALLKAIEKAKQDGNDVAQFDASKNKEL